MAKKMDWLRLETRIREALDGYEKDILTFPELIDSASTARSALYLIAEIIGQETGRGYPMENIPNIIKGEKNA